MKNRQYSFEYFILSLLFGLILTVQINSPIQFGNDSSIISREIATQINKEKTDLNVLESKLNTLNKEYRKIERALDGELIDSNLITSHRKTKALLGQEPVTGEGIVIKLEAIEGQNIAYDLESYRILLKIVNNLKSNGGEVISINGQILTPRSEIVLAGNHINVNNVPISQPYEIKVIGNQKKLYEFFQDNRYLNLVLEKTYKIKIDISKERKITINPVTISKEYENLAEVS